MARIQEKFPHVFLACPFDNNMAKLIEELGLLPWIIHPANEKITSDHLLVKITKDLKLCDFAVFDISGWNANVCLELGLAKGLNIKYYILNNNSLNRDAPSDIKGIERIDYNWNRTKNVASLFGQIKDGIFKKQFLTIKVWQQLKHLNKAEDKFTLFLYVLSKFNGVKKQITLSEIKRLAKGMHFRQEDFDEITKIFIQLKIFKKTQKSGAFTLIKRLYK